MPLLKNRSKEAVRENLLDHLSTIIDNPETSVRDKLKAIEITGREFGLFVERKQINVDINTIVRQLTDGQLQVLGGADNRDSTCIDVHPRMVVEDHIRPSSGSDPAGEGSPGDSRLGSEDKYEVDKG